LITVRREINVSYHRVELGEHGRRYCSGRWSWS